MKTFTGVMVAVLLISLMSAGPTLAKPGRRILPPHDEYVVVALRRASYIEGAAVTDGSTSWIGEQVSFGNPLVWLNGIRCEDWSAEPITDAGIFLDDPNLSDLSIAPLNPSVQPVLIGRPMQLYCNGGRLVKMLMIDNRVIVIRSPTGVMNAILERPLNEGQISKLQSRLKALDFYTGEITGEMDKATRKAVSRYAEFRGAKYVFHSAALTENLLDGLGVEPSP